MNLFSSWRVKDSPSGRSSENQTKLQSRQVNRLTQFRANMIRCACLTFESSPDSEYEPGEPIEPRTSGICDRVRGLSTLEELDRLKAQIVEPRARLYELK